MSEQHDDFERTFAQRYASYVEDGFRDMDTNRFPLPVADDRPRRPSMLRAAVLSTATVSAAVIIVLAATQLAPNVLPPGTATESPDASAVPTQTGSQAPSLKPTPTRAPQHTTADWPTAGAAEAVVRPQLDLASTAFWTLETPLSVSDWTLRVGTLDGHVTREVALTPAVGPLDLTTIPQPVGPANGRVLYLADEGQTASLHIVDAVTGDDRELASTKAIVPRLAISPDGLSAFYLANDRRTGAFEGIFRVDVVSGQTVVMITPEAIQPVTANATLAVEAPYFPLLAVSNDGSMLSFASCTPAGCDLYSAYPGDYRPPADPVLLHTRNFDFGDTIIGIAGDLLIGARSCGEPPCDGFAVDLPTGERWPLGGSQQPFVPVQLIEGPRGPLALGQSDGEQGNWEVEALDLTDRTRTAVFSASFELTRTVVGLAEPFAGAELPAGWFLIYRNADASPNPYPDYSAATLGGAAETPLPAMAFPGD